MAYWSAENATKAYISTVKMGLKAKEPDVAEFISAIAAGDNAQLMVVACGGAVDSTTLALVAAAHQTGGHVICIVRGLEELNASQEFLGMTACPVQFVVGEAQEILLLKQYEAADFVLIDCDVEKHEEILKSVQMGRKQNGTVVVGYNAFRSKGSSYWRCCGSRTQLLPIGEGLLVTKFGATPTSPRLRCGTRNFQSKWLVMVDKCTGEEHVFRVRIPTSPSDSCLKLLHSLVASCKQD